jgi:hypothetical protein
MTIFFFDPGRRRSTLFKPFLPEKHVKNIKFFLKKKEDVIFSPVYRKIKGRQST